MGDTTADAPARGGVRGWLTGLSLSRLWQLGVLVVLAATALFGGLDTVDKNVTVAEVGTPFSNGQFTITVERASTVSEGTGGTRLVLPAKPGTRYLGLVATVHNDGTIPGQLANQLRLQNQPHAEELAARRLSDSEQVGSIGAGLTEEVVFLWALPSDAIPPDGAVIVHIWKKRFRELISTYGKSWVSATDEYVQIEVPVTFRP